jgi:succinoglycan biosynthesis protein ExoA
MALAQPAPAAVDDQLVTVAIPARDEEAFIGRCLDSVLAQDHRNLQVVVVDGASSDRTAEIVRARAQLDPRVELLTNPAGLIPASLNIALGAARAAWFVRVDAHSTVRPDYVGLAVAHLATGRWAGVGGRKDGVGVTTAGRAIALALGSPFGVGNSTYHHGTEAGTVDHIPFGAYRTEVLRELGGWDERLSTNEDFELDYRLRRAGHELLFDPALRIEWRSRQRMRDLFGQYRRYGSGKADVALLHPESVAARHLAAPALVAGLAASVALLPWRPRTLGALGGLYGAALAAGTAAQLRSTRDPRVLARVPVAFAAMHLGWGLGFWQGVAARLRSPLRPTAGAPPEGSNEPAEPGAGLPKPDVAVHA